jgi:hypothetical protein
MLHDLTIAGIPPINGQASAEQGFTDYSISEKRAPTVRSLYGLGLTFVAKSWNKLEIRLAARNVSCGAEPACSEVDEVDLRNVCLCCSVGLRLVISRWECGYNPQREPLHTLDDDRLTLVERLRRDCPPNLAPIADH